MQDDVAEQGCDGLDARTMMGFEIKTWDFGEISMSVRVGKLSIGIGR
jgi:hypothetical protein